MGRLRRLGMFENNLRSFSAERFRRNRLQSDPDADDIARRLRRAKQPSRTTSLPNDTEQERSETLETSRGTA